MRPFVGHGLLTAVAATGQPTAAATKKEKDRLLTDPFLGRGPPLNHL